MKQMRDSAAGTPASPGTNAFSACGMKPPPTSQSQNSSRARLRELANHRGMDAAAHVEIAGHLGPAGRQRLHQVVQDAIDDRFVERTLIAVGPQIELERLQLDAQAVG